MAKELNEDTSFKISVKTLIAIGAGLSALIASVNPEKSDYFYFVADTEGGHMFSRNVREHKEAVKIFKKKRRLKKK